MIFQFFNLLDDLTVADNVLLPAQLPALPAARPGSAALSCWTSSGSPVPGQLPGAAVGR